MVRGAGRIALSNSGLTGSSDLCLGLSPSVSMRPQYETFQIGEAGSIPGREFLDIRDLNRYFPDGIQCFHKHAILG